MMLGLGQASDSSVWQGLKAWFDPPPIPMYGVNIPGSAFAPPVPVMTNGMVLDPNAAQSISNDTILRIQGAFQEQVNAAPCPFTSTASGICCAEDQVVSQGECVDPPASVSWWIWAGLAGVGALMFLSFEKGRN